MGGREWDGAALTKFMSLLPSRLSVRSLAPGAAAPGKLPSTTSEKARRAADPDSGTSAAAAGDLQN